MVREWVLEYGKLQLVARQQWFSRESYYLGDIGYIETEEDKKLKILLYVVRECGFCNIANYSLLPDKKWLLKESWLLGNKDCYQC